MLIALADGVTDAEGEAAVQRVADRCGAPDVQTNEEFTEAIAAEIDALLTVIYVLLLLAIVIALMSIASTLSLSIHERPRELGLLRAVGQTRPQTRPMVRAEAVTVALFGTIGGLGVGLFLAWALTSALASEGFGTFAIPPEPSPSCSHSAHWSERWPPSAPPTDLPASTCCPPSRRDDSSTEPPPRHLTAPPRQPGSPAPPSPPPSTKTSSITGRSASRRWWIAGIRLGERSG